MSTSFTFVEAVLIGLLNYFLGCECGLFGCILPLNAMSIGYMFGAIYGGDPVKGLVIGATINLYYIGNIGLGGAVVQDQNFAMCVALPLAMKAGIDAKTALMVAIPFGVLLGTCDSFRRLINGRFHDPLMKAIDEMNIVKMYFWSWISSQIVILLFRGVLCTIILLALGGAIGNALQNLPPFISTTINTVGSMLPALGLIICATIIGQDELIPFFFLGFLFMSITRMPSLATAVIAGLIAVIYVNLSGKDSTAGSDTNLFKSEAREDAMLKTGDHIYLAYRTMSYHRLNNSLEYLYGNSYCMAVYPVLKKIYKDNKEGLKEAVKRHALPFMTEQSYGHCLTGAAMAMEEEIAKGNTAVTGEQIVTIKSSLMGPLAGFGDTINWVTLYPLFNALFTSFAVQGQVWSMFWSAPFFIYTYVVYVVSGILGYNLGRSSIMALLKSGQIKKVMAGAGVLGMWMMGALSAQYTSVHTALVITAGDTVIELQSLIDGLVPNLLAMVYVGVAFFYVKKGGTLIKVVLASIVIAAVGTLIGFFA